MKLKRRFSIKVMSILHFTCFASLGWIKILAVNFFAELIGLLLVVCNKEVCI